MSFLAIICKVFEQSRKISLCIHEAHLLSQCITIVLMYFVTIYNNIQKICQGEFYATYAAAEKSSI